MVIKNLEGVNDSARNVVGEWSKKLMASPVSVIMDVMKRHYDVAGPEVPLKEALTYILEPVWNIPVPTVSSTMKAPSAMDDVEDLYNAFLFWHYEGTEEFLID